MKIKWSELTDEAQRSILIQSQRDIEDGDVTMYLRSDNPFLQERIDESVPFNLEVIQFGNDQRVLLIPEYSGPSVLHPEQKQKLEAELLPVILPNDITLELDSVGLTSLVHYADGRRN